MISLSLCSGIRLTRTEEGEHSFYSRGIAFLSQALMKKVSMGKVQKNALSLAQVEQDWLSRGFSCGIWVDPPGQVWEDYVHSMDELLMVLEGDLKVEMQGRAVRLKEGGEVLIRANVRHTVRNEGGTTARWLYGYKSSG